MLLERMIAIFYVGQYETCTKKLGHSLLLLSVSHFLRSINVAEALKMFICSHTAHKNLRRKEAVSKEGEKFDAPQINCLNTPASRTLQINILFVFALICHIVAISAIAVVYIIQRRKSRLATTLTSRFQFSENMTSSRLLITLSGIQLVIFLTYGISMMFLRTTQQKNGGLPSIYRSNVQAAYMDLYFAGPDAFRLHVFRGLNMVHRPMLCFDHVSPTSTTLYCRGCYALPRAPQGCYTSVADVATEGADDVCGDVGDVGVADMGDIAL
ncbi:unnamed protein product [Heligmosomoides polygyrus]|uniref:G protein-coupled receptor n=1 Tax=Heligmosomoides polygyrus TaxID=6339 RepID=A0A183GNG5_HELPZ|nr:unnamed protein product [Heligmosomoides polygyrus]